MTHLTPPKPHQWIRVIDISTALVAGLILSPFMLAALAYRCCFKHLAVEQVEVFSINDEIVHLYQFHDNSWFGLSPRLINLLKGDIGLIGEALNYSIETPPNLTKKPGLISISQLHQRMGLSFESSQNALNQAYSSPVRYLLTLGKSLVVIGLTANAAKSHGQQQEGTLPLTVPMFGLNLSNFTMAELVDNISVQLSKPADSVEREKPQHYAFINADCVNIAHKQSDYAQVLKGADHILGDGLGIRLAAQWLGYELKANLNGTDLFPALCQRLETDGKALYLLGGQQGVAEQAAENMLKRYPELSIAGTQDGFFNSEHTQAVIDEINNSGADILLVAMGAPKQELWLAEHKHKLKIAVAIGVGGLFDFYSQRISRAPLGLRQIGMEWTWRLAQEPKRMWRRYILGNPAFLYRTARHVLVTRDNQVKKAQQELQLTQQLTQQLLTPDCKRAQYKLSIQLWWQNSKPALARVCKRGLDISVSISLLILLMPLLAFIALLIRAESPGAVLYSQKRAGKDNRAFTMWKFRSMYIDAEQRLTQLKQQNEMQGGVLFKMKQDPRITKIGKFIRKASIDELPQLWNVLKGEMSLVGPRPALLSEVDQYQLSDRRRLEVKPGITCIWQVSGRSDIPFDKQVELDVDYIYQQSLAADIWLLVKTIPAVLLARGAY